MMASIGSRLLLMLSSSSISILRLSHYTGRTASATNTTTTTTRLFLLNSPSLCCCRCIPQQQQQQLHTTLAPQQPTERPLQQQQEEEDAADDEILQAAGSLDIRVGQILKAWRHPEADSLYVEEVDVGEAEPRTICSGLVNFLPLDQLQDSKVVVLANLKPRNMRGIKSSGMLMAASDESHETVELLIPPEGSMPGERIWFGSEAEKAKQPDAVTPNQVQKKKIWEFVQPHLGTTDTCQAVIGNHPMRTSAGTVSCKSLKGARIS